MVAALAAGYALNSYIWESRNGPTIATAAERTVETAKTETKDTSQTFTGGDQGFIDLKLSDVTNINHNVKRFRFELPEKDAVSGLTVACE